MEQSYPEQQTIIVTAKSTNTDQQRLSISKRKEGKYKSSHSYPLHSSNNCNENMLKRLWKKVKGSHPTSPEPSESDHEHSPDHGNHSSDNVNNTRGVDNEDSEPPNKTSEDGMKWENISGDNDVQSIASSEASSSDDDDSSSGSEGYISLDEMIVIPRLKNKDAAHSQDGSPEKNNSQDDISHSQRSTSIASTEGQADSKQSKNNATFDLKLLAMTQFPDFDLPDGELTDESDQEDDDSTARKKAEAYSTKEDQDVAVFTDIAKRLKLQSLLHLLQGHVRNQNLPAEYLEQYNQALAEGKQKLYKSGSSMKSHKDDEGDDDLEKSGRTRKKQFRWAEVTDDRVRSIVYEIESVKDSKDMWWTPEEMNAIRTELIEVVQFFRRRRPNYITSVEVVARNNQGESVVEDHMKQLMADSFPRGLETHIVKMLSDHRKSTVQAVLEEQKECKSCNDTPETTTHCLREQSLAYSAMSSKFAANMGKCDEIDALKAGMSKWRTQTATANEQFFS